MSIQNHQEENNSTHINECWSKNHQEDTYFSSSKNHYKDTWFKSYRNKCILRNYYYSEERFPYQLMQRKWSSEGLIVNPITNSADKSTKNYRKSFLTKLCKSSHEKWTSSANWSHWVKHQIKLITAKVQGPMFNVASKQEMT